MEDMNAEPALIQAVATENMQALDALLKQHADVNERGTGGYTALIIAAASGNLPAVKKLLEAGAKMEIKSEDGWEMTALVAAVHEGHSDVAELLISKGAKTSGDLVALATNQGQADMVRVLIKAGVKFDVPVQVNLEGDTKTPLEIAIEKNYTDIADILRQAAQGKLPSLKKAASASFPKDSGRAVAEAAEAGDINVVRQLLKQGGDPEGRNHFGKSALMVAAMGGHIDIINLLLDAGAKVDTRSGNGGETALVGAIWYKHEEAALLLIDKGAPLNEKSGGEDKTALHLAICFKASEKVLKAMLAHGADPNVRDYDGNALHTAVSYKNAAAVRLLVKAGADLTDKSTYGKETPIQEAIRNADPRVWIFFNNVVPDEVIEIRDILRTAESRRVAGQQPKKPPTPKGP